MSFSTLLVDDDPGILRTMPLVFETKDFKVTTASSAADAIAALTQQPFDVVITDMRMETPTAGYDVIRHAKAQPNKPIVVLLSAYPIPPTEWRRAGADAMFMKGTGLMRMLDEVEEMARTHARTSSAKRPSKVGRRTGKYDQQTG